ncbi:hypothetical protein CAPTEDRAFT_212221 [Capitella teleta]|uniref:Apple domain-containing protein n=1 Tax=Capitella teleta TaxID=283909 RepID=R7UC69_CAPTE|nr:hypothetical protein CAPTEDRAFT_212221 [Capitella teleta]|eukprot:ELU00862.1 hypothetical protein CAPTEDRAFT_212221 [Capitella teleta]
MCWHILCVAYEGCTFEITENQGADGATKVDGANSLDACLAACKDDQANCKAVEYGEKDKCWKHTSDTYQERLKENEGVNVYMFKDCAVGSSTTIASTIANLYSHGTCSFETYVDQSADGATKVDGATSLDACLDACSDHSCYAVEYSEEYGCYRHTTAYVESTMKDNAGVTIYKYKTCTADCPVWDKKENMQGVGGISFADASTSAECKAACIADDNCAGYDLDVSTYVESTMKDNAGVTIYKYKTCTADCPVWDKKENMQGVGGISFADASTSAECKAACIADDNCAGFDLDVSGTPYTCWLHMSPDNFDPPKAKTGVNLYILVSRCSGSSTTIASTIANLYSHGTCSFETYVDQSADGATKVDGATSLDACLDACSDHSCYAVEYSEEYGCYRHTTAYVESTMKDNAGVTIYKYKTCTADCPVWDKKENMQGVGGISFADASTSAECKAACIADDNCAGFDLDVSGTPYTCWLHMSPDNFDPPKAKTGVNLYILVSRCSGSSTTIASTIANLYSHGTCSFETYVDQSADGATKVDGATSLDDCLDACSDHSCYAVEYSEEYGCYRHTTAYVESTMKDNAGVTIYKYKTCTADCPVWDKKENMHGNGAIIDEDQHTESTCKDACIADENCVGFDLDKNDTPYACWLHMNTANFDPPQPKVGVDLYILVSRCSGSSTVAPANLYVYEGCNFVVSEDMSSSGAAKVNGADTLDACLSACKGDQENCKAVEYSEQYKCYMHSVDTYEANLASNTGVNVYKFQDCGRWKPMFNSW